MNKNITREKLDEIIGQVVKNTLTNVVDQYEVILKSLTKEDQENPLKREITAIYLAQANVIKTMKEIFQKVLEI